MDLADLQPTFQPTEFLPGVRLMEDLQKPTVVTAEPTVLRENSSAGVTPLAQKSADNAARRAEAEIATKSQQLFSDMGNSVPVTPQKNSVLQTGCDTAKRVVSRPRPSMVISPRQATSPPSSKQEGIMTVTKLEARLFDTGLKGSRTVRISSGNEMIFHATAAAKVAKR